MWTRPCTGRRSTVVYSVDQALYQQEAYSNLGQALYQQEIYSSV